MAAVLELARVLAAGGDPGKVVFSGVGKSREEIRRAIEAGILSINLESEAELGRVSRVASRLGLRAPVAFRVNPDVDPNTHPYISTGLKQNKFGVAYEDALALYRRAASLPPLLPMPAHGTVVLVSDWLDPLDRIESVIRHYASAGVRGHIVQVLDPAEEDLPFEGHVKFEGLETEGQHTIRRVESVRAAYGARLAAQREGLQRLARPANWTVHLHRTDRPPQTVLLALYLAMADLRRLNAA